MHLCIFNFCRNKKMAFIICLTILNYNLVRKKYNNNNLAIFNRSIVKINLHLREIELGSIEK